MALTWKVSWENHHRFKSCTFRSARARTRRCSRSRKPVRRSSGLGDRHLSPRLTGIDPAGRRGPPDKRLDARFNSWDAHGEIAQLAERRFHKAEVAGSAPALTTERRRPARWSDRSYKAPEAEFDSQGGDRAANSMAESPPFKRKVQGSSPWQPTGELLSPRCSRPSSRA